MMFRSTLLALVTLTTSSLALIFGVDSSTLVPEATFAKALSEGFTKAILRGFEEACGVGGEVDPNFVGAYKNARAAGFTNIDAYWFPCTGSTHSCKAFATQIAELGNTFTANSMDIGRIWIDLEVDPVCNNWDFGTAGNLAQAKEIISAMKASGFNFGIYSSPGEWADMFGSDSVVLDDTAPLWFANFNDVETLTFSSPFGGWTSAFGHQYTDVSASGDFDLSVFSS